MLFSGPPDFFGSTDERENPVIAIAHAGGADNLSVATYRPVWGHPSADTGHATACADRPRIACKSLKAPILLDLAQTRPQDRQHRGELMAVFRQSYRGGGG